MIKKIEQDFEKLKTELTNFNLQQKYEPKEQDLSKLKQDLSLKMNLIQEITYENHKLSIQILEENFLKMFAFIFFQYFYSVQETLRHFLMQLFKIYKEFNQNLTDQNNMIESITNLQIIENNKEDNEEDNEKNENKNVLNKLDKNENIFKNLLIQYKKVAIKTKNYYHIEFIVKSSDENTNSEILIYLILSLLIKNAIKNDKNSSSFWKKILIFLVCLVIIFFLVWLCIFGFMLIIQEKIKNQEIENQENIEPEEIKKDENF